MYCEQLRTGWWLLPQVFAVRLIIVGWFEIGRSPLASGAVVPAAGPPQARLSRRCRGAGVLIHPFPDHAAREALLPARL